MRKTSIAGLIVTVRTVHTVVNLMIQCIFVTIAYKDISIMLSCAIHQLVS